MMPAALSRVLIVDDEPETTRALQLSLRCRGWEPISAGDGNEALTILQEHHDIDIVVTDYSMPGMNGIQLLKEIRKRNRTLPVIMMTAYGAKEMLVNALRNQCHGFIEKPFGIDDLIAEIERVRADLPDRMDAQRDISELVPMLVHQLNNPLSSIVGSAQLGMVHSEDNSPIKDKLQQILKATMRIEEISSEILNLGKGLDRSFDVVDLSGIVQGCIDSYAHRLIDNGIMLDHTQPEWPVMVSANRFGLEQMLCNLITNALEAMGDRDTNVLHVDLTEEDDKARITVADTGCGMTGEMTKKIFTPYYSTKKNGTGLGMAVVRRVVDVHGWNLLIDSKVDKGSTFTISMPLSH